LLLAKLALTVGNVDQAELHARALARAQARSLPEDHTGHGDTAALLATISAIRGNHEEALRQARFALALWEPKDGLGSHAVQRLRSDAAAMLLALGRIDEATDELDLLLPHVQGGPEEASVRLRRCEAALRQRRLDAAGAELQALEHAELVLGAHEFSYAVLRALVDLRSNELQSEDLEHIRDARARTPFTSSQIAAWLTQLGMSAAEKQSLSID
jgi:hypothetical protein